MVERIGCHVYFSGHVQGVGFRWQTKSVASAFGVSGFVRNLPDGRVELLLEGTRDEIASCLVAIESRLARYVRDREVTWPKGLTGATDFEIRR